MNQLQSSQLIVAVSTTYDRLLNLKNTQFPRHEALFYVLSCQGEPQLPIKEYVKKIQDIFGEKCEYAFLEGFGLSRNRNAALALALDKLTRKSGFIHICDDDVTLDLSGLFELQKVAVNTKTDIAVGVVSSGDAMFKEYKHESYEISPYSAAKVSSIEMLVSSRFLSENKIAFDESFGLGTLYPSGEEFIFCNDVLNVGGRIKFFPITICDHPPISSGQDFFTESDKVVAKGAMLSRALGKWKAFLCSIAFSFKKWPSYKKHMSLFKFILLMIKGVLR